MNLPAFLVKKIALNWPFANGSGRFVDKFGGRVQFASKVISCRTTDGFEIDVLGDDHIGRHLLLSGKFDRTIVQTLLDFAKPEDSILDVGANIGYVSCCLLNSVKGSRLICMEPQPLIVDLLRRNLARFDASRSRIIEAALSDNDGRVVLNIDTNNRGASSIEDRVGSKTVTVQSVSAERLLAGLTSVDIVKIDIEGHEIHAIRSAEVQLGRLRPRVILFEDRQYGASVDGPIGKVLGNLDYAIYGIRKSLNSTSLVTIRSIKDCRYNDYLAVFKGHPIPPRVVAKYRI